jgi:hypothetical protein
MQRALEAAVAELVLGPPLAGPDEVNAWLDRHAVTGEDARSMRQNLERLLVYRELVRDTLRNAVLLAIPRTAARLGPLFEESLDRFLAERAPRTHYLRDVTTELLDFSLPHWRADPRVPAYAIDLARHEALELIVAASADASRTGTCDLDLDSALLFVPSLRVVHYDHAVHRLPEEPDDRSEPERTPTALAVYRDRDHAVRYLELTPLAAAILGALLGGDALGGAVTRACATSGVPLGPAVLEGASRLLGDLSERGCLLGVDPLKGGGGSNKVCGSTAAEEPPR